MDVTFDVEPLGGVEFPCVTAGRRLGVAEEYPIFIRSW
jgi:hypothetical protein